MEAKVYNQKGKEAGSIELPENIFGLPWNADLVHQVAVSMMSNARIPVAHTKTRGEISGGGKKPWKQKGTGRARHGSSRSPIWIGGGITHGPRNDKNFKKKINKKMKTKALYTILSKKLKSGEVLFVDSVSISEIKTKKAAEIVNFLSKIPGFEKMSTSKKKVGYIALSAKDKNTEKSFGNLPTVSLGEIKNINPLNLLNYKYLVIANPDESMKALSLRAK